MRRARGTRSSVVMLVAVLVATLGLTVAPTMVRAADEVAVVASGSGPFDPFVGFTGFSVAVRDDGQGTLEGSARMTISGQPTDGTGITCLQVDGNAIAVGGIKEGFGPFPGDPVYFTIYLTDNGPVGTSDTFALAGPTDTPTDCDAPSPTQQPLASGQVTILQGPSGSGTVAGNGTTSSGFGITTFAFDATRDTNDHVTGTFSTSGDGGVIALSGSIVCLDIRDDHAMLVGQGTQAGGGPGGPGGPSTWFLTFFVDDLGSNGSGDLISFNPASGNAPPACLAAQEQEGDLLITGDIDINGQHAGTPPPAAATIVASGGIEVGQFQADTFDVAAISDGAGHVDGTIRMSRSGGSSASGTVTCLVVTGNDIVVGGQSTTPPPGGGGGGGPAPVTWFTLYLTDNGPDGSTDTASIDGPTSMAPPDCASTPSVPPEGLYYGQVTIITGSSEAGSVHAAGTHEETNGFTRSFTIDATRDEAGDATGTFSVSENGGLFQLSGTVDCLDIRGDRAMVIGHGLRQDGLGFQYATLFLADAGPDGAGDSVSVNAYRSDSPFQCLAAQEYASWPLTAGDIDIHTSSDPEPSPSPEPSPTPEPTAEPTPEPTPTSEPTASPTPPPTPSPTPASTAATSEHPFVASVTSPNGGPVTIAEAPTNDPPPLGSGYTFIGRQLDIEAPDARTDAPLTLVFTVDAALLASVDPDLTAATVTVFRNGVPVDACSDDPDDDPAEPDPCVADRQALTGGDDEGDARITVLSSRASSWNVGDVPDPRIPDAPSGALAIPADGRVTVTWRTPVHDGWSPITGYRVTASPGGATINVSGSASSAVVTGLSNGVTYTFSVVATNAVGDSSASADSNAVNPRSDYQGLRFVATDPAAGRTQAYAISPDGTRLLYVRDEPEGSDFDLYSWKDGVETLVSTGPTRNSPASPNFHATNADGTAVLFSTSRSLVAADDDQGSGDLYLRQGSTTTLVSTGPADSTTYNGSFEADFLGASPDLSQIAFAISRPLVTQDQDNRRDVYLWAGGTVSLLSLGPTGGNASGFGTDVQPHFATWDEACGCLRAYFATWESLTADDPVGNEDYDEYEAADGELRLVTPDMPGHEAQDWGGVMAASVDGSRIIYAVQYEPDATHSDYRTETRLLEEGVVTHLLDGVMPTYAELSFDTSRFPIITDQRLDPADTDDWWDLYAWDERGLHFVSVGANGWNGQQDFFGAYWLFRGDRLLFSTDGRLDPADADSRRDLYAWDGTTTTLLSTIDGGGAVSLGPVTADGTSSLVGTEAALTADDHDTANDPYRYALDGTGQAELLTPAGSGTSGVFAGNMTADGSTVLLQTSEALLADDTDTPDTDDSTDVYVVGPVPGARDIVSAGGTVSTGNSATAGQPLVTSVTTPVLGEVTITEGPPTGTAPAGYSFLDRQLTIEAPTTNPDAPLTLVLTVDETLLAAADPDLTAATLVVFRDGTAVDGCTATAPIVPDPCVSLRETLTGGADEGDARITILTSHASTWNVGAPPPYTAPGAPTGVTALRGDASAGVSWTAPADDGGAAITGYTVTASPGGATASVDGSTISTVVTGLINGTSYTFTVRATNVAGTGPASAPSNAVTPGPKLSQSISFTNPGGKTLLQTPFTVTATASSGLPVTISSTTTAVCTVSGLQVALLTAGTCSLTATQPGNLTYNAATPVTRAFTVSQIAQSITFTSISAKTLAQSPVTASATASSGLPVTLTSNALAVCTVDGTQITLVAAGTCSITASQPGDTIYKPATSVTRTFSVTKANQTITFPTIAGKTMLQTPFSVTATASSGLPVTVASTTPTVCTVGEDYAVTLLTAGSCTLTASQPGNATYNAATSVSRTFTVSQVAQTLTFVNPGAKTLLQTPFTVAPTASSGLPVTLASTTPAVCTTSGFEVTLLSTGTCTLRATQPGNVVYKPANALSRSFSVTKAAQTITFPNPGPQSMTVPTLVVSAWASSNLPVTLGSTTTGICTNVGDVVTLKKAGTCKIRATQAGDATYAAAQAVVVQFTVTATGSLAFVVASGDALSVGGQPFSFQGASIYHTSNPGAPNPPARIFSLASQAGLNSVRIVNSFVEDGVDANAPYAAADWQRVDSLLARARGAGMRVVLDLSAFRNHLVNRDIRANGWQDDCLPGADRSAVDYEAIDPYRAGLAGEWEDFLDFVVGRVNTVNGVRYRDDATIAVISIAGEPQPPGSQECGKATSGQGLTDFYARTLGYLASIDANHLRSNGGLIHVDWQQLYGGSSGIDGEAIFALSANTLPSLHTYPAQFGGDGTPIDHATPVHAAVANSLDKPWFTEEFGWTQDVGDAVRASRFAWLYAEQDQYGSDGALFWNLGLEEAGGSHDVSPAQPATWAAVQAE